MRIYIDMDGVMCKLTNADLRMLIKQGHKHFPPKFFVGLEPMPGAIEAVNALRSMADVYILTAPSVRNPLCYTEKRLWIEKHFDLDLCKKLIISPNKALLRGDILIDDYDHGKGQEGFEGELIHFGSVDYPDWDAVLWEMDKRAGRKPQIRRSWKWIRQGMDRCRKEPEALEACLAKAKKSEPITSSWVRLLTGQEPEREAEIFEYEDFYDIPPGPGKNFWDTQVKNHPFGAINGRVRLETGEVVEYDRLKPVSEEIRKVLDGMENQDWMRK